MTRLHRNTRHALAVALAGGLGACAGSDPSRELLDARAAYQDAVHSSAAQLRPDELVDAKQALDAAEAAHEDDAGSEEERHLAYLAQRRARIAMSRGAEFGLKQDLDQTKAQLLKQAQGYASSSQQQIAKAQAELEQQRMQRQQAEAVAQAALADLKEVVAIKEEQRGLVITLSGAVLFKSGDSELLDSAKVTLEQVAKALQGQQPESKIVIEGHTDSRGTTEANEKLSQERAQAVAKCLEQNGIESARLQIKGMGEAAPIADNATAEGRANNRRVEIIVQPAELASPGAARSPGNGTLSAGVGTPSAARP